MPYKSKEQQREYQRLWRLERRREWIEANGPCKQCGSADRLEIDHVDPSKKVDHRLWTWSAERRAEELAKCQVLCHACHQAKTSTEPRPVLHRDPKTGFQSPGHEAACRRHWQARGEEFITNPTTSARNDLKSDESRNPASPLPTTTCDASSQ